MKKQTTLRNLREQAGKSVKEVAEILNVTTMSIYRYESGKRQIDIEHVLTLAKLYDVSEREIIEAQLNSRPNDR